jgi:DNA-binding transcriptional MerR regulator
MSDTNGFTVPNDHAADVVKRPSSPAGPDVKEALTVPIVPILSIGDLQQASGLPRTTIHCYLRLGLLPRPQKTAASRSLYTEEHLHILERIRELKEEGLSLAEIEAELRQRLDEANDFSVDLVAQESERIRNRIVAAAVEEFSAKGYKQTHVTTIIKKLGITANLFYSHFPSKRALLVECVSAIHRWGILYADSKREALTDPGERFLWLAIANTRVFNFGPEAMAQVRAGGSREEDEECTPIREAWAETIERIMGDYADASPDSKPSPVPDELIASSFFGALDETMRTYADRYTRREILRAHLWLFLAARAARNGLIDFEPELERYEPLLERFGTEIPPLPPRLQT